jgi:DNA repair exonuclease SbcCD nuclease subunit
MMKLALASDVHLEFGHFELVNRHNAEVLILSGDIFVAVDAHNNPRKYTKFFDAASKNFPRVYMVMGNHEHYQGDYAESKLLINEFLQRYDNIVLLDNEYEVYGSKVFFGGTLWTDMNKEDPITMNQIRTFMNDYTVCKNSNNAVHYNDPDGNKRTRVGKLMPEDTVAEHKMFLSKLSSALESNPDKEFIVIGHHGPSKLSTHAHYAHEVIMNGAFTSDLSEFVLDNPRINLWTHGHTHDPFDYIIGETRIVCNPRGYVGYETSAYNYDLQYIDLEN